MWVISAPPSPDLLSEGLQKLPSLQLIESNICYVAFSDFVLTWASSNFKAISQLDPMWLTSLFKSFSKRVRHTKFTTNSRILGQDDFQTVFLQQRNSFNGPCPTQLPMVGFSNIVLKHVSTFTVCSLQSHRCNWLYNMSSMCYVVNGYEMLSWDVTHSRCNSTVQP